MNSKGGIGDESHHHHIRDGGSDISLVGDIEDAPE